MAERFIARSEAVSVLSALIDSDILSEEIEDALQDIMFCIEQEQLGYHCWGGENELVELFSSYSLWTDELNERVQAIHDKYSFTPAPYEAEELKTNLEDE